MGEFLKYLVLFSSIVFLAATVSADQDINVDTPNAANIYIDSTISFPYSITFSYLDGNFDPATKDAKFTIYISEAANDHNYTIVADVNADDYCGAQTALVDYATTQSCTYSWTSWTDSGGNSIPEGNWLVDINMSTFVVAAASDINSVQDVSDNSFYLVLFGGQTGTVTAPNATGTYIGSGDFPYSITFTYQDGNFLTGVKDVNFSIYISEAANDHNYTIIADANADDYCGGQTGAVDYTSAQTCTYSWTSTTVPDGNWLVDINAYTYLTASTANRNDTQDVSDNSFFLDQSTTSVTITSPGEGEVFVGITALTIQYSATDTNSGVKKYWISMDSLTAADFIDNSTNTSYHYSPLSIGNHVVYVKYQDFADNNSSAASAQFRIDSGEGGAVCGNSYCEAGEDATTCPRDCPAKCGDDACTHTESAETCPADCVTTVVCGDGVCSPTENYIHCPEDCPTPPEAVRQTIREIKRTGKPTAEEIAAILTEAGASQNAIEKASETVGKTTVERDVKVEKITDEEGNEIYLTTVTITITNPGNKKLTSVKVIENLPKSVAFNASEISSTISFEVLKDDPIIRYSIGNLAAGGSSEITYTLDKELTEEQIAEFSQPIVSEAEEEELPPPPVACTTTEECDDGNPCTEDICIAGECSYVNVADGTNCGFGKECKAGVCTSAEVSIELPEEEGMDLITTIILVILVLIIMVGGAYYYYSRVQTKK